MTAKSSLLPAALARRRRRMMFSMSMMASSTRTPSASAKPPSVMVLSDLARLGQDDDGREQRQRDGEERDQRGAPAAQEGVEHDQDQGGAERQRVLQVAERALDERGGPVQQRYSMPRWASAGLTSSIAASTASVAFSVLAPNWLEMVTSTPGRPMMVASPIGTDGPIVTVATWPMRHRRCCPA